jgi:hypothetical protein
LNTSTNGSKKMSAPKANRTARDLQKIEVALAKILASNYYAGWSNPEKPPFSKEEYINKSLFNWIGAARGIVNLLENPKKHLKGFAKGRPLPKYVAMTEEDLLAKIKEAYEDGWDGRDDLDISYAENTLKKCSKRYMKWIATKK